MIFIVAALNDGVVETIVLLLIMVFCVDEEATIDVYIDIIITRFDLVAR